MLATSACGGSSDDEFGGATLGATPSSDGTVDVTGTWSGRWTSRTGVSGSSTMTLARAGSRVSGDVRFTGSPCFAGGAFEGTLSGRDLTGALTAGGIRVDLRATVTGGSLDGTYDTVRAGACTGDTGTFSASR